MKKVVAAIKLDGDELVFSLRQLEVGRLPLSKLKRVIQIIWGDSLFGPIEDSMWVFDFEDQVIIAPSMFYGWDSDLRTFVECSETVRKLEAREYCCPNEFATKPLFTGMFPGLWRIELSRTDPATLEAFLSKAEIEEVNTFSFIS